VISGSLLVAAQASAEDLTISVAPKEQLFRAFDRASEHLASCQMCVVTIKVVGSEQVGKAQVGQWVFPETIAPGATLRILGGYDEAFASRAPFAHPTVLVTSERRSGPVLEFQGKRTALKELHLSGFAIDVGAGNRYDATSGALQKGASSSWPILAFGSIAVERLIIADNVFVNAANGVAGPRINAASSASEIIVRNNVFLNNVYCWQVVGLPRQPIVQRYLIEGNSFIRNHPYNPDATTSNPGTLEIGNKDSAGRVEIRQNLFAYNSGGAIFPQWDDTLGPPMAIAENLFYQNGALFENEGEGKGAIVGKFNGSANHGSFSPEEIEKDFSWDTRGNVVVDPQLALVPAPAQTERPDEEEPKEDSSGVEIVRNQAVDTYAPRWAASLQELPFPQAAAKPYGAAPSRVVTP
jgi:hypothetical protein